MGEYRNNIKIENPFGKNIKNKYNVQVSNDSINCINNESDTSFINISGKRDKTNEERMRLLVNNINVGEFSLLCYTGEVTLKNGLTRALPLSYIQKESNQNNYVCFNDSYTHFPMQLTEHNYVTTYSLCTYVFGNSVESSNDNFKVGDINNVVSNVGIYNLNVKYSYLNESTNLTPHTDGIPKERLSKPANVSVWKTHNNVMPNIYTYVDSNANGNHHGIFKYSWSGEGVGPSLGGEDDDNLQVETFGLCTLSLKDAIDVPNINGAPSLRVDSTTENNHIKFLKLYKGENAWGEMSYGNNQIARYEVNTSPNMNYNIVNINDVIKDWSYIAKPSKRNNESQITLKTYFTAFQDSTMTEPSKSGNIYIDDSSYFLTTVNVPYNMMDGTFKIDVFGNVDDFDNPTLTYPKEGCNQIMTFILNFNNVSMEFRPSVDYKIYPQGENKDGESVLCHVYITNVTLYEYKLYINGIERSGMTANINNVVKGDSLSFTINVSFNLNLIDDYALNKFSTEIRCGAKEDVLHSQANGYGMFFYGDYNHVSKFDLYKDSTKLNYVSDHVFVCDPGGMGSGVVQGKDLCVNYITDNKKIDKYLLSPQKPFNNIYYSLNLSLVC